MLTSLPTPQLSQHIFDSTGVHFNNSRIYLAYFGTLPNIYRVDDIDEDKLIARAEASLNILVQQYAKAWDKNKLTSDDCIMILEHKILLNFCNGSAYINFPPESEAQALKLMHKIRALRKRSTKKQELHIIISTDHGLDTKAMPLRSPSINIRQQYNDDLAVLHKRALQLLQKKNQSGLFLFHGAPGTGKSTYIRSLIRRVNKTILFLTPALATSLDSPAMCRLLLRKSNSIFVIEDAEELVVARKEGRTSTVSMLLNITDGLLGASLGIQVIATFNTSLQHIDPALMRKGRLLLRYEFKPLAVEKATTLLQQRKLDRIATRPLTLAEIYHAESDSFELDQQDRRPIGFRTCQLPAHE